MRGQTNSVGWPVTCTDCGRDLSQVPPGEKCPACGGARRTTHVTAYDSELTTDAVARLGITYGENRPWQEQWRAVLDGLEELRKSYAGRKDGPADSSAWRQLPIEFCEDCWHLKDWLKGDPAVSAPIQGKVEAYVQRTTFVRLAGAVANTHKHRARKAGRTFARIGSLDVRPGELTKVAFRIQWLMADGTAGSNDALELAEKAVMEWRQFFGTNGLDEAPG